MDTVLTAKLAAGESLRVLGPGMVKISAAPTVAVARSLVHKSILAKSSCLFPAFSLGVKGGLVSSVLGPALGMAGVSLAVYWMVRLVNDAQSHAQAPSTPHLPPAPH
ncbi:MAG: hypothetical protein H7831_09780 [Magnetococcus sp. WYHC-3]